MNFVPDIGLLLDGVVAVLLIATIVYCIVLYRQLSRVRNAQQEMHALIASFDHATSRAQAGIGELKRTNDEIVKSLQSEMSKGRILADELAILTESGNRLASRIEGGLTDRPANDVPLRHTPRKPSFGGQEIAKEPDSELKSEAERELLEALRASR